MLARDLSDVQKLGAFLSVEDRILPEAPINFAAEYSSCRIPRF